MIAQSTEVTQQSRILEFSETERIGSAISPEIWKLNTRTISPDATDREMGWPLPYSLLLYSGEGYSRFSQFARNSLDGKWGHLRSGGLWFLGYKHGDNAWGMFKPISPKIEKKQDGREKPRKYEQPTGVDAGVIIPRLSGKGDLLDPYRKMAASRKPLIITEGAKKALTVASLGFPCIAVPGHTMGYRTDKVSGDRHLLPEIAEIIGLGFQSIIIAFDSEKDPDKAKAVGKSASRLKRLIKALSPDNKVGILTWDPDDGKGIDDLLVGGKDVKALIKDFDYRSGYSQIEDWGERRRLSLPGEKVLCNPYLPSMPVPNSPIVLVRAPKGSGKTELLSQWIKDKGGEGIVVSLYHLNQLGENCSKRLNIPYNNSMTDEEREYLFNRLYKKYMNDAGVSPSPSSDDSIIGFASNIASLVRECRLNFEVGEWADNDMWLILDECEQVIQSALSASIFQSKRYEMVSNILNLMKRAYQNGKLICLDADLSDFTVDFIKSATGADLSEMALIDGEREDTTPRKAFFYNALPSLLNEISQRLQEGGKGAIQTSAKEEKSKTSAINLEKYYKERFPDISILRIDSDTIADPSHPAYLCVALGFPNLSNYDLVIYTPCIETGVDLNPKKMGLDWNFVAGIGYGVQTPERFCQGLARYRGDCDRLIHCPYKGSGCFLQLGGEIFPLKIALSITQYFGEGIKDSFEHWDLWAKINFHYFRIVARENLGRKCYRAAITELLRTSGYEILAGRELPTDDIVAVSRELSDIRDNNWDADISERETAKDLNRWEAADLEGKKSLTPTERAALAKWDISQRYGVKVSKSLIRADDEGLYPAARLRYGLMVASPLPSPYKSPFVRDEMGTKKTLTRLQEMAAVNLPALISMERFTPNHPSIAMIAAIPSETFDLVFRRPGKGRNRGMARLRVIADLLGYQIKAHQEGKIWEYSFECKWGESKVPFGDIFAHWQSSERIAILKADVVTNIRTDGYLRQEIYADIPQSPDPAPHKDLGDFGNSCSLYNNLIELEETSAVDLSASKLQGETAAIGVTTAPIPSSAPLAIGARVLNFLNQRIATITEIFSGKDGEVYAVLDYGDYRSASPTLYLQAT